MKLFGSHSCFMTVNYRWSVIILSAVYTPKKKKNCFFFDVYTLGFRVKVYSADM